MANENNNNIKTERIIDEFTKQELKAFKAALTGYGRVKRASKITGIHVRTLNGIAHRGSGLKGNIELIRTKLLNSVV